MDYRTKEPENLSGPQRFGRWLALKQYQIEVTFGVYMFTPTEKFVFWSVVFLLSAMGSIATILYLPQHILFIINRAWFYVSGGETVTAATATATTAAASLVHGASKIVDAAVKSAIDLGLESVVEGVATTLTALSSAASAAPTEILREL